MSSSPKPVTPALVTTAPVTLSEVQASLSLFAEALVGRPVAFWVDDDGQGCWPNVPSDPTAIDVLVPSVAPSRHHFRAAVLQQLLLSPPRIRQGHGSHPLFAGMYALVEDHRVHALTRRDFPGGAKQLDTMLGQAVDDAASVTAPSMMQSLRLYSLSGVRVEGLSAACELVDRVTAGDATGATSQAVAVQLCVLFDSGNSAPPIEEMLAAIDDADDELALPSDGPTSVSLDGGTPTEFVDSDGLGGGQLLGEAHEELPTVANPSEDDDAEPTRLGIQVPLARALPVAASDVRSFVYDEWDFHEQQHRPAWCTVIEEHLEGDDHDFIADVRLRHQALRSRVRRSFMKLRAQELLRVHRSDDGDELDLDAAIEAVADRRGGAPMDERLHIRRDRGARDVATAFLVDLSASTSSAAVPPEPEPIPESDPMDDPLSYGPIWDTPPRTEPVRRVIDVAKDAVALMGDALHELGDRYAIYGFSGTGRDAVEFKIGKDFGDRVSPITWAAVAEMKPLRYTRMGPAVRHAAAKLAAERARTKLLIVVSDGYPQDTDYGTDRHDRDYGIHDTARALADANDAGIETFCVTIDPAGHDYLRTMCPDHRYLVIEDVESLPEELAKLYLGRFHTVRRVEVAPSA